MNKNKQNKVSFADLARKIQSKYKRAEYDPLEKADMEAELEALQIEQENMRTQLGLNQQEQPMQEFSNGGKIMYPKGGSINSSNIDVFDGEGNGIINWGIRNLIPEFVKDYKKTLYGYNKIDKTQDNSLKVNPNFQSNLVIPQKLPEDAYLTPEQLSGMGSPNKPLGFQPSQDWLNSIGWNNNIPIKQDIKSSGNVVDTKAQQPQVDPFAPANELMYRTGNNSLVSNPNFANFHSVGRLGQQPIDTKTLGAMNTLSPEQITTMQQQAKDAEVNGKGEFWDNNKQYLPYAISGASNIASNLLMAAMAKKNQQRINPVLATPERMNMEPQAEQFRKDANVSKNIGLRQARDLGTNAGATLANMGAIGSGVDRNLANTLTNLYGQQEQYNTGAANQFALQNQDAVNRANIMNAQFGQQTNQDRMSFFDDAIGTIPGVMKDIRMDKADKEMRDALNAQALNSGGRNYYAKGDLFSKGGLTYEVKEVDANGNPTKTELVKDGSAAKKKYQELLLAPKTTFQKQKFNTNRS